MNREEKFNRYILPLFTTLFSSARRLTGNNEDAEDLTQETLMKALRFIDSFDEETNPKAWLLTILKNSFYDFIRKKKRLENLSQNYYHEKQIGYSHNEQGLDKKTENSFERYLLTLPKEYQLTLTLFYVNDCTYKEIADIMECPVGTVRSRLNRGRALLKKKLLKK